jgi:hydrogenase nickel incorporation protein HypA/HybF
MHELSIALSILDLVAEQAAVRGVRVVAVRLKVGALSGVVPAALEAAYDLARETSATPEARLVIEEVPVVVRCASCDRECRPVSVQLLQCPSCHAPTPEVVRGRELEVVALEVVDAGIHVAAAGGGAPEGPEAE